jgi:hypothetical protein
LEVYSLFARRSTGADASHGGLRRVDRSRWHQSRTVTDYAGSVFPVTQLVYLAIIRHNFFQPLLADFSVWAEQE